MNIFKNRIIFHLSVFLAPVSYILILLSAVLYTNTTDRRNYVIVVGADTQITGCFLYSWKDSIFTKIDFVQEDGDCSVESSIADFPYLENLASCVLRLNKIGREDLIKIPVYYLMTYDAFQIYPQRFRIVRERLKTMNFVLQKNETISSLNETAYLTTAVNFILNMATIKKYRKKPEHPITSYAIVNLGRSALQIGFSANNINNSNVHLESFQRIFNLVAYDYSCLGYPILLNRVLFDLYVGTKTYVEFSCWLKEYMKFRKKDLVHGNCGIRGMTIQIKASGNYENCFNEIDNSFTKFYIRNESEDFINSNHIIFLGSFFRAVNFLKVEFSSDHSKTNLIRETARLCDTDDNTMKTQFGKKYFDYDNYCFIASYLMVLYTKFNISDINFQKVQIVNKIDGRTPYWTYGYILRETKFIPNDFNETFLNLIEFIIMLCVCCAAFIFFSLIIYVNLYIPGYVLVPQED